MSNSFVNKEFLPDLSTVNKRLGEFIKILITFCSLLTSLLQSSLLDANIISGECYDILKLS